MAGAGGIEPPNGGIKIRCLTAWLRPNWPNWNASGCDAPRANRFGPVYRGTSAISTGWNLEFCPEIRPLEA